MATMDALNKHLVQTFPAGLLVWVRYVIQVLSLLVVLWPQLKGRLFISRARELQILRGILGVVANILIVISLRSMPLADMTAILFVSPAVVAVLAPFLLRERLTVTRSVCVCVAMTGMLLIMRPGAGVFSADALLMIVACISIACTQVLARALAHEDARTTLFWTTGVGALLGTLSLPWAGAFAFASLTLPLMTQMLVMALLATLGQYLLIRAFQIAPASGVASISYVQIVFAIAIGLVAFHAIPDFPALMGILVILASGALLTWRERRAARRSQAVGMLS